MIKDCENIVNYILFLQVTVYNDSGVRRVIDWVVEALEKRGEEEGRFVAGDRRLGWTGSDWPARELRGNMTSDAGQAVSQTPHTKLGSQAALGIKQGRFTIYFENLGESRKSDDRN